MADFVWDFVTSEAVFSLEGGTCIFVTIPEPSMESTFSFEGSGEVYNPVGLADFSMVSSLSGQFLPTYRGRNIVRWSAIGNTSFDLSASNEAGWKALEWEGNAYRCLKFKNSVIVYGSGGISVLFPVSDPISTWSEHLLDSGGVLGIDAVVDSEQGHLFIGRDYKLYIITENSQSLKSNAMPVIKAVGYSEFIKTLTGTVKMFYEPISKVTYISGSNKTLLLSGTEITEVDSNITGVIVTDTRYETRNSTPSGKVSWKTQELRFGNTNFKTIRSIAFDFDMLQIRDAYCTVWMRNVLTQDFTVSKRCKITKDGIAFVGVTAKEFQIQVEFVPLEKLAIRSYQITVQFSDKRFGYGGQDVKQISA